MKTVKYMVEDNSTGTRIVSGCKKVNVGDSIIVLNVDGTEEKYVVCGGGHGCFSCCLTNYNTCIRTRTGICVVYAYDKCQQSLKYLVKPADAMEEL